MFRSLAARMCILSDDARPCAVQESARSIEDYSNSRMLEQVPADVPRAESNKMPLVIGVAYLPPMVLVVSTRVRHQPSMASWKMDSTPNPRRDLDVPYAGNRRRRVHRIAACR